MNLLYVFWYDVILVKQKHTFYYLSALTEVSKNVFLLFYKKYEADCASVRQELIKGNSVLKNITE